MFSVLINWIYSQNLEEEDNADLDFDPQFQLWILAHRVLIPKLQNATMRLLFAIKRMASLRPDTLQYTYEIQPKKVPYVFDLLSTTRLEVPLQSTGFTRPGHKKCLQIWSAFLAVCCPNEGRVAMGGALQRLKIILSPRRYLKGWVNHSPSLE